MARLVVQSRASVMDTPFEDILFSNNGSGVSFLEYFHNQGIGTLKEDLVSSCHGNNDISGHQARQSLELAVAGHKVVAVMSGGLVFAKPSTDAALMPLVPTISVPTDWYAFVSVNVPSGVAAVAGVGINNYISAAHVTAEILNNEFGGVYLNNGSSKLSDGLRKYGLNILGNVSENHPTDGIVIGEVNLDMDYPAVQDQLNKLDQMGRISIAIPKGLNLGNVERFMSAMSQLKRTVYTRGEENAAILAAKFMASYNGGAQSALLAASKKKRESYPNRNIDLSSFVGVAR